MVDTSGAEQSDLFRLSNEKLQRVREEVAAELNPRIDALLPDLSGLARDFAYEKVWSRSGLSMRERSIAVIAADITTNSPGPLRMHVLRGLSNGLSKSEIAEIFVQLIPYVGFSLVENAAVAVGDLIDRVEADPVE